MIDEERKQRINFDDFFSNEINPSNIDLEQLRIAEFADDLTALELVTPLTPKEKWSTLTEAERDRGLSSDTFIRVLDPNDPTQLKAIRYLLAEIKKNSPEDYQDIESEMWNKYQTVMTEYFKAIEHQPEGYYFRKHNWDLDRFLKEYATVENMRFVYDRSTQRLTAIPAKEYFERALYSRLRYHLPDSNEQKFKSIRKKATVLGFGLSSGMHTIQYMNQYGIEVTVLEVDDFDLSNFTRVDLTIFEIGENKADEVARKRGCFNPYAPVRFFRNSLAVTPERQPPTDSTNIETLKGSPLFNYLVELKQQGRIIVISEAIDQLPTKVAIWTICNYLGIPVAMSANAHPMINCVVAAGGKEEIDYFLQGIDAQQMKDTIDKMNEVRTSGRSDAQVEWVRTFLLTAGVDNIAPGQMLNFLRIAKGTERGISQIGPNAEAGAAILSSQILNTLHMLDENLPVQDFNAKENLRELAGVQPWEYPYILKEQLRVDKYLQPEQRVLMPYYERGDSLPEVVAKATKAILRFDYKAEKWIDKHHRKKGEKGRRRILTSFNNRRILTSHPLRAIEAKARLKRYPLPHLSEDISPSDE
jgi:hypothetical protein